MKHKYLLLILPALLLCLYACKKAAQSKAITLTGRWFITKHDLKLLKGGVQVGQTIRTDYTSDDFDQFFDDGTGYQSARGNNNSPSLNTFHYTFKDSTLTIYINASPAVVEKVTKLTATEFAVHYETEIADPNNPGQPATEVDDYEFIRQAL
ncbi:hypothetical protein [Mucilaginibacter xinganensis]|nr:hypothetical protein [Mucilaginibacter xinganensis]